MKTTQNTIISIKEDELKGVFTLWQSEYIDNPDDFEDVDDPNEYGVRSKSKFLDLLNKVRGDSK